MLDTKPAAADEDAGGENDEQNHRSRGRTWLVWVVWVLVIAVGPLNFVLYKLMFVAYGETRAFFVSQGVNFLYVVYGKWLLAVVMCDISREFVS
jgi:hypothetical protein